MKKVLMVLAPKKFKDPEFFEPKEILEKAGIKVLTACSEGGFSESKLGVRVKIDVKLGEVKVEDYDALIFIGGSGSSVYFNDKTALNLAKKFHSEGKIVGAICIAPTILANAGVLNGKRATAFETEKENIAAVGTYTDAEVEVDGKIITAKWPTAAKEFGRAIAKALGA